MTTFHGQGSHLYNSPTKTLTASLCETGAIFSLNRRRQGSSSRRHMGRVGAPRKVSITLAGRPSAPPPRPKAIRRVDKNYLDEFVAAGSLTWFEAGAARAYQRQVTPEPEHCPLTGGQVARHAVELNTGRGAERAAVVRRLVRQNLGGAYDRLLYSVLVEGRLLREIASDFGFSGSAAARNCAKAFRDACKRLGVLAVSEKGRAILGEIR